MAGRDDRKEGNWEWFDGLTNTYKPFTYTHWGNDEPDAGLYPETGFRVLLYIYQTVITVVKIIMLIIGINACNAGILILVQFSFVMRLKYPTNESLYFVIMPTTSEYNSNVFASMRLCERQQNIISLYCIFSTVYVGNFANGSSV